MPSRPAEMYLIAIGASAGGLEAIGALLGQLPTGLPAATMVVMHVGASSHLAKILSRRTSLPVAVGVNGETIEPRRVYVAVPDRHLLVHDNHVLLRRGPRENMARPAVDPLFRTAALSFGSRSIGVVLSGKLSDGSAGLRAIKACGGTAMVQDPQYANSPDMPRNALRYVDVDCVGRAEELAHFLAERVRQPPGPTPEIPATLRMEAVMAIQESSDMAKTSELGKQSPFTCPECNGALWEIEDGPLVRYRCHVGHAFSADVVLAGKNEEVQTLLQRLLRSNRERAALTRRMADGERRDQRHSLAEQLELRAMEYEQSARLVDEMLRAGEAGLVTNGEVESKLMSDGEEGQA